MDTILESIYKVIGLTQKVLKSLIYRTAFAQRLVREERQERLLCETLRERAASRREES